jgi:ABC-2 type transport system permease protein
MDEQREQQQRPDSFTIQRFSPFPLFVERMSAYWIAIWKCWRTVLDWAVWIYIFIPGLFIFGGMYRDLLRNPPSWLFDIPSVLPLVILGLVQLAGHYRTFAESGDGLFLHRMVRWTRGLTIWGFVYCFFTRILLSTLSVAIISPLLLRIFSYDYVHLSILIIYTAIFGFTWTLLKDRMVLAWSGWKRTVILLLLRLAYLFAFVWIAALGEQNDVVFGVLIVLLVIAGWQMKLRLRIKGSLMHEIAVENAAYMASVGWILSESMDKKPVPKLRGPMLFRRSKPLLKHRDDTYRLLDSWLKSSLRRVDMLKPVLYFVFAGAAAIVLTPLVLALMVWLVLPMLVLGWIQRQWLQWLSEPYIALFHWDEDILVRASAKARIGGALPFVTLWGIIIGVRVGLAYGALSWLAIAVLPVIGYFWLRLINDVVAAFTFRRKKV